MPQWLQVRMIIGILADIHANREALDAVLERMREIKPDRLVFLGDLVGYGADPCYVLDMAMRLADEEGAICLLGNHDEAAFSNGNDMNENARDAMKWTQRQLSEAHLAFLRKLPLTHREGDILFVHASASRPEIWSYVRDADGAQRCFEASDARITICGHTHLPAIFYARGDSPVVSFKPVANKPAPLLATRRHVIVAGSVGQPRDDNPAACAAVLDTEAMTVTMLRAPYDTHGAARKIAAAGLPGWLGMRLHIGR